MRLRNSTLTHLASAAVTFIGFRQRPVGVDSVDELDVVAAWMYLKILLRGDRPALAGCC
jgi:hypothetical protein